MRIDRVQGLSPLFARVGGIAGRLRVDLRSVPAVRRFASTQAAAMIFDVLELESLRVEPGALSLKLKLPQLA